ncbi:A disintegrin and metalloproteinase with thrombospondin motifs 6-like [Mercenaria mercenaria]|uniref:A disintegrin and metalloproteinase with thrombospondin motifs 6-like n=1 Tax=Mercenaria mercenaria TaxID=6596 RepID=UPI00234F7B59|nr:A disintegrin and metalloproteinase with thrombospondin motifs 6-like [Mercenaria mercenaria]
MSVVWISGICLFVVCISTLRTEAAPARTAEDRQKRTDILLSSLQEYQTVVPEVVSKGGHFLSYKVQLNQTKPKESSNRIRRGTRRNQQEILTDSDISEYRIFYKFSVFGKEFHFDLTLNTELLSPGFYVEYQDSEGVLATSDSVSNCYYIGQSREPFISTAAISNCNGLHGVFSMAGRGRKLAI